MTVIEEQEQEQEQEEQEFKKIGRKEKQRIQKLTAKQMRESEKK